MWNIYIYKVCSTYEVLINLINISSQKDCRTERCAVKQNGLNCPDLDIYMVCICLTLQCNSCFQVIKKILLTKRNTSRQRSKTFDYFSNFSKWDHKGKKFPLTNCQEKVSRQWWWMFNTNAFFGLFNKFPVFLEITPKSGISVWNKGEM